MDKTLPITPTTDVKVLVHGWLTGREEEWYEEVHIEYGKKDDVVLIAIDWGKYSKHLYTKAVSVVPDIGNDIAIVIGELSDIYGIPLSRFHVIGHSLGAQISGFAGNLITILALVTFHSLPSAILPIPSTLCNLSLSLSHLYVWHIVEGVEGNDFPCYFNEVSHNSTSSPTFPSLDISMFYTTSHCPNISLPLYCSVLHFHILLLIFLHSFPLTLSQCVKIIFIVKTFTLIQYCSFKDVSTKPNSARCASTHMHWCRGGKEF